MKLKTYSYHETLNITTEDGRETHLKRWKNKPRDHEYGCFASKGYVCFAISGNNLGSYKLTLDEFTAIVSRDATDPLPVVGQRTIDVEKELKKGIIVCPTCMSNGRIVTTKNKHWLNEDCPLCSGKGWLKIKELL